MSIAKLIEKRTRIVGDIIEPHVHDNQQLLDFGCGNMEIPGYILKQKKVSFTGVDVIDYPNAQHDFQKLEPDDALPFSDDHFDASIACFALHHTNDPEFFFRELIRVARKRIIILEDTFNTWVGKARTKVIDRIYNGNFLLKHAGGSDMNIPYNFKSVKQWKALIAASGLKTIEFKRIYPHPLPFIPAHNILMVIDK